MPGPVRSRVCGVAARMSGCAAAPHGEVIHPINLLTTSQRYDGMQLEDRLSFGMSIDETHLCSRGGFKPNATIENNERYERVSLTGKRRPAAGGDGRRCRRSDEAIHGRRSARQHDAGYIGRREDDRRVSQGRNDGDRAAQRVGHTMAHRGHAAEAHPRQA